MAIVVLFKVPLVCCFQPIVEGSISKLLDQYRSFLNGLIMRPGPTFVQQRKHANGPSQGQGDILSLKQPTV